MSTDHRHIIIVGGGPVGLFLGIALLHKGLRCSILEKREEPVSDSRSLGIHPVSLDLFDELGITAPFLNKGLKIRKGLAFNESTELGAINFEHCPKPHDYILACPQYQTESILRECIRERDADALITGADFLRYEESDTGVEVLYEKDEEKLRLSGDYLIGCDGKNSQVRQKAGIHYSGTRYPDTYVMGDFADNTGFGPDAAVYLHPDGLVECFPLPNNMRRWVVKTDEYIKDPDVTALTDRVYARTGSILDGTHHSMLSAFGVQHFQAEFFTKGRVILAGDAAHVVSPIGGQGMNLGWIDGLELAECLAAEIPDLKGYHRQQSKMARKVARRAEINMMLGRKRKHPFFRDLIVKLMLSPLLQGFTARLFTMRGLKNWWI